MSRDRKPGQTGGVIALAAALAACAPTPLVPTPAPAPIAPQITEETLRARARAQHAEGIKRYEAGDYDRAMSRLHDSLEHGLLSKQEQGIARKHLAFIHCLAGRPAPCAQEFRKAFEIDPDFALAAAEDGHPTWGPVYRTVRATLIAEREAAHDRPTAAAGKAERLLADGITRYHAGDFAEAQRILAAAFREGLQDKRDQVRALKHSAFCLCLLSRWSACQAEFMRIYDIDPGFDLTPAEAGHPSWTRTFAGAKARAKKALADKAREKTQ